MSTRIIGYLLAISLAGGGVASCRTQRPGDAETTVDTAYAIAAYRTEAQARLDHVAIQIARLRVGAEEQAGVAERLEGLDRRREELGRQIEAFDPSAADWERRAAALDSALAILGQDVDRLSRETPGARSRQAS